MPAVLTCDNLDVRNRLGVKYLLGGGHFYLLH